jgi:hypothetical protein
MPKVTILGDSQDGVMAQCGGITGFAAHRVVWGFGFLKGSLQAKWSGLSVPQKTWILATMDGRIRQKFVGDRKDLPPVFKHVLRSRLFL